MSQDVFALDDDWGTLPAEEDYPAVHSKQHVSKSVLRKRRKAAQKLQELSKNAVLPGRIRSDTYNRHYFNNHLPVMLLAATLSSTQIVIILSQ